MPWCDSCDRFFNPNSLRVDGTCPACGRRVDGGPTPLSEASEPEAVTTAPWHFKVLLAATVVYLGYRLYEGVLWVAQHL